jgi:hypothetical protein
MSYLVNRNLSKFLWVLTFVFIFMPFFSVFDVASAQERITADPGEIKNCPVNGLNRLIPGRSPGATQGESRASYSPDVACGCKVNQCRLSTATNFSGDQSTEDLTSTLQFTCVDGSTSPSDYLTKDGKYGNEYDMTKFRDIEYYRTVANSISIDEEIAKTYCNENEDLFDVKQDSRGTIILCTEKLGVGFGLREIIVNADTLVGDTGGAYFVDIFSIDAARQVIPAGSTCKISPNDRNGVAYWQYPGYFDVLQGKNPGEGNGANIFAGGQCGSLVGNGTSVLFTEFDLFGNQVGGTQTLFGCLPNSINGLTAFIVRLVTGLAIVITFAIVIINLIQIVTNSTNGEAIAEFQKKMFAAIYTLIGILLTVTILSIFGLQIIGFGNEGVGGGIFRFFVGG